MGFGNPEGQLTETQRAEDFKVSRAIELMREKRVSSDADRRELEARVSVCSLLDPFFSEC